MKPRVGTLLALWLSVPLLTTELSALAQHPNAPDTPEPGSVEAIARATSEPRFASPWVAYVPESASVPSPTDHFGRIMGAPSELASSSEIYAYLRKLDAASPRVAVFPIGESWEGREILLVAVADEDGIARLDELKAHTAALADPRRTTPEQAEVLIASGARPFYYFNAALHADESGSPEAMVEMAYRLAVSEQPWARRIRENVVVLINPVSNPDGRDKMVDWFYRHLRGKTVFDELPRISPPYWGRYVFVDANRDAHQLSQRETQAVARMFFEYHPQVIHDLHEAIPLLLTWNGTGPYNPRLDPIVFAEFLEMSFHEVTTLTALGMPGVWTWDFGEGFGHHYLDSIAMNHNSLGRGYETFGSGTAETVRHTLDEDSTTQQWYRPSPPPASFQWSARDNLNYTQTAALAILDWSARHPDRLLRNFYRKGYNSWQRGVAGSPRAIAIPADQGDPRRVAQMVSLLRRQHIEVHRAGGSLEGTFLVLLDQPYRDYALDLLQPQEFPEETDRPPYDDVSWALPVHYGLEAVALDDAAVRDVPRSLLEDDPRPAGSVDGEGPWFVLADLGQESLLEARYRLADLRVELAKRAFASGGDEYPAGTWLVPPQPRAAALLREVATDLGLTVESLAAAPDVPRHDADPPRLGVWVPWADTDSIGWVRHTFDQRAIPYQYLRDEDIRDAPPGALRERVDAILYGHVDLDLQAQIHGLPKSTGPLAFTATARHPSHGTPATSEDITGGIGFAGLAELQRFVEGGGLLVALGRGTRLVLEGGLVRSVRLEHDGAHTPGAELRARFVRPEHPRSYGYGEQTSFFRGLFESWDEPKRWLRMAYCTGCLDGPEDPRFVVARWGGASAGSELVVSGGARNQNDLVDRPAILSVPVGDGHIVAVNFNPLHRDLNRSDHRVVWNALLSWNDL
ncbi:MAG TPA: M14 family zinc carboxypeptidase [Thermoanaerobaculia bacterium]|nr:M14 family zinc carboxypeptidase [Thermoanaerobaculia bacterium]